MRDGRGSSPACGNRGGAARWVAALQRRNGQCGSLRRHVVGSQQMVGWIVLDMCCLDGNRRKWTISPAKQLSSKLRTGNTRATCPGTAPKANPLTGARRLFFFRLDLATTERGNSTRRGNSQALRQRALMGRGSPGSGRYQLLIAGVCLFSMRRFFGQRSAQQSFNGAGRKSIASYTYLCDEISVTPFYSQGQY